MLIAFMHPMAAEDGWARVGSRAPGAGLDDPEAAMANPEAWISLAKLIHAVASDKPVPDMTPTDLLSRQRHFSSLIQWGCTVAFFSARVFRSSRRRPGWGGQGLNDSPWKLSDGHAEHLGVRFSGCCARPARSAPVSPFGRGRPPVLSRGF